MERFRQVLAFDESLILHVQRWHVPRATVVMRAFTRVGDPLGWVGLGLLVLATGRRGLGRALRLGTAAGLATAVTQVLKRTCKRSRPSHRLEAFEALTENPDAFSFPSGHTAAAAAVATAVAGTGLFLGTVFGLLATGIGASRVYLGAHFPLDVIAGALVGVAGGMVVRVALLEAQRA